MPRARPTAATPAQAPERGADTRARAGEITASQAAERLGLTKQAIGLWTAKPGAPVRKTGTSVFVRWPDFARWREQELVDGAKKAAPQGTFAERRAEADARAAEIQVELRELELAERRGEVVAVADYEAALATILDRLTARLRAMPVRLSHLGPEIEAAAEAEAERVVEELHVWDDDVVDETDATAPPAAA